MTKKTVIHVTPELARAIGLAIVANYQAAPEEFPYGAHFQRVIDRLRSSVNQRRDVRFVADATDGPDVEMLIRALVRVAAEGGADSSTALGHVDKLCKYKGLSIVDFIALTPQM